MTTVVVLSGKGGTGKTSVTASLAALERRAGRSVVLADADVDASNLPLLLHPTGTDPQDFVGGELAVVDAEACSRCGECVKGCRFSAISLPSPKGPARVSPSMCEGCAVCTIVCPEQAITMTAQVTGRWSVGETRLGPLVFAELSAGGESSGKLVTRVRQAAAEVSQRSAAPLVLIDGPPGIGCPVIAALSGADLAVMVTEPTPSARADLERVLAVAAHFHVRTAAVINKSDLNPELARVLASELAAKGVALFGSLPYDEQVSACQQHGLCPAECEGSVSEAMSVVHARFSRLLKEIWALKPTSLPLHVSSFPRPDSSAKEVGS